MRVPFVENRGQLDRRVAFSAPTFFGRVFVTRDGKLVYSLPRAAGKDREAAKGRSRPEGWTLTETLVSGKALPAAGPRAATGVSYFRGNDRKRWQSGLRTYDDIHLGEVWRGVSVSLQAQGGNVEKVFMVHPGARIEEIRLRLDGARSLRVDREGALVAATGNGDVRFTAPSAYQELDGVRRPVAAAYALAGKRYGFRLGSYDPTLAVVIDPLLQSTYLDGNVYDDIRAMTVHPTSGEVLVTGSTSSTDFPGTTGGAQPTHGGGLTDGFVARFNPSLTTLLQATYFGGDGGDGASGLAVQPSSGEIVVTGGTGSANFPGTSGGAQEELGGAGDGFVARFDSTLTSLLQATYLGGSEQDFPRDIAIHPSSGEALVAGETSSTDLPGTTGGARTTYGGGFQDGFVARLDPSLTTLLQATYLGGSDNEERSAIAVHPTSGEVLVATTTRSSDFPGATGGAQPESGGGGDVAVARHNGTLTSLLQTTYLGGSNDDYSSAIAVHPTSGEVLVAGFTYSADLPGVSGGAQPEYAGGRDGFVVRLAPSLTEILQATYLGGRFPELLLGLDVYPTSGEVFVAGQTNSHKDFPGTSGGLQPVFGPGGDEEGFVARLSAELTALRQATYLGGRRDDFLSELAIHTSTGEVLVAGRTFSQDFPGTAGGAQPAPATVGSVDAAFVARLTPDLAALATPQALGVDPDPSAGSDGNGVLEPEETVVVRPTWKNSQGSPASPTGTASAFTEFHPGANHPIPDDSATYGNISAGSAASCEASGDCYGLSLPGLPFGRSTHLDTVFTETLSTRDYMYWTLHVGDSFADVPRNYLFYQKVETLLHHGITAGCMPTTYCPDDSVPRDQMAIFIAKAIAGGGPNVPSSGTVNQSQYNCVDSGISLFSDVSPTDIFCKHVHYLAAQNVTLGCGPSLYCPTTNVARGEMAIFIARAVVAPAGGAAIPTTYGPDPTTNLSYSCDAGSPNLHFTDVATSDSFCKHVHYLWARGIIGGCSATEYCPTDEVNRGAMAKFLANAFNLALYGP